MKYAVPTDDGMTVGKTFGRARKFAIYNEGVATPSIFDNEGASAEHGAGTGAVAFLAEKGVTRVFAPELGPKAADALKRAGMTYTEIGSGIALDKAMADAIKPRAS